MCNIGFGDMPTLYNEQTPKARKVHVCCECGSSIMPGEKYERVEGLWDGEFSTFKTCLFCRKVRAEARRHFDLQYEEGFVFGELWECVGIDFAATV